MKKKVIKVPIFNNAVTFIEGDIDHVLSYLGNLHGSDVERLPIEWYNSLGICFKLEGNIYIWLRDDAELGALVHECGHAAFSIMRMAGADISDEEVFCYLQQYLFENIVCLLPERTEATNPQVIQEDTQAS